GRAARRLRRRGRVILDRGPVALVFGGPGRARHRPGTPVAGGGRVVRRAEGGCGDGPLGGERPHGRGPAVPGRRGCVAGGGGGGEGGGGGRRLGQSRHRPVRGRLGAGAPRGRAGRSGLHGDDAAAARGRELPLQPRRAVAGRGQGRRPVVLRRPARHGGEGRA